MTFDPNDTRLTAYALGELEGAERDEIETQLAGCAESRKYVEEVREMARLLPDVGNESAARWPFELVGVGYALLGIAFITYGQVRQRTVESALRAGLARRLRDRCLGVALLRGDTVSRLCGAPPGGEHGARPDGRTAGAAAASRRRGGALAAAVSLRRRPLVRLLSLALARARPGRAVR